MTNTKNKIQSLTFSLSLTSSLLLNPLFFHPLQAAPRKNLVEIKEKLADIRKYKIEKSHYAVNMQDGGFILKEENHLLGSDFDQTNPHIVSRTYRSRSLNPGYFGMGWCSDFESKLIFQGRGVIRLVDCQSSRPRLFKSNASASSYINESNSLDQIIIKMGFYERRIKDGKVAKYDFKGRLIEIVKENKEFKLLYGERNVPIQILTKGQSLSFEWHSVLDLVEKVKSETDQVSFKYDGFKLILASSSKIHTKKTQNNKILYAYDDLDNLTLRKTTFSGDELLIEYDREQDKVFKINGECQELYAYKKKDEKRSISTVSKLCRNQGSKTEFEFQYAENKDRPLEIKVSEQVLTKPEMVAFTQGFESEGAL